jgi:hypothetical protein
VDTEEIEKLAEPVAAMILTAYDTAAAMEATQASAAHLLAHFPGHIASHKIPVAQAHLALVKVIAVLRFPQSCPRTLLYSMTTIL